MNCQKINIISASAVLFLVQGCASLGIDSKQSQSYIQYPATYDKVFNYNQNVNRVVQPRYTKKEPLILLPKNKLQENPSKTQLASTENKLSLAESDGIKKNAKNLPIESMVQKSQEKPNAIKQTLESLFSLLSSHDSEKKDLEPTESIPPEPSHFFTNQDKQPTRVPTFGEPKGDKKPVDLTNNKNKIQYDVKNKSPIQDITDLDNLSKVAVINKEKTIDIVPKKKDNILADRNNESVSELIESIAVAESPPPVTIVEVEPPSPYEFMEATTFSDVLVIEGEIYKFETKKGKLKDNILSLLKHTNADPSIIWQVSDQHMVFNDFWIEGTSTLDILDKLLQSYNSPNPIKADIWLNRVVSIYYDTKNRREN